ncbi:MAG: DNA replication complex GINS family protein [Thermoproteus sp.]|nr:DNA replication complex GINS family protein [Thermoproteus sp.]
MPASDAISSLRPARATALKDLPQILGAGPLKSGVTASLPLFLALKLAEIGAAQVDESLVMRPQDVSGLNFMEEKEEKPVKLPEDFYVRVKATIWVLKRKGDARALGQFLAEVRRLLIKRVEKLARILAGSPEKLGDEEFASRLTPEEKALALSLYLELLGFVQELLR